MVPIVPTLEQLKVISEPKSHDGLKSAHHDGQLDLIDVALMTIKSNPDRKWLIDGESGRFVTFEGLLNEAHKFLRWLSSQLLASNRSLESLDRGSIVCVFAPTSIEYCVAVFALASIDIIVCPINPSSTSEEVARQIEDCGSKLILATESNYHVAMGASMAIAISHQLTHQYAFEVINLEEFNRQSTGQLRPRHRRQGSGDSNTSEEDQIDDINREDDDHEINNNVSYLENWKWHAQMAIDSVRKRKINVDSQREPEDGLNQRYHSMGLNNNNANSQESHDHNGNDEVIKPKIGHQVDGHSLSSAQANSDNDERSPTATEGNGPRPALLLYSSGTTGLPKGVICSHDQIIYNVIQHCIGTNYDESTIHGIGWDGCWQHDHQRTAQSWPSLTQLIGDGGLPALFDGRVPGVYLAALPFYYSFGMIMVNMRSLLCGDTVILLPSNLKHFNGFACFQLINKYKVTSIPLVPPIASALKRAYEEMVVSKDSDGTECRIVYDLGSVKQVICTSAALNQDQMEALRQMFPALESIDQSYGMTETFGTLWTPRDTPPGSIGKPLIWTQVQAVDIMSGDPVEEPYVPGEILVRGPQMMLEYLNNPVETDDLRCKRTGWIRTGDIGYYDAQGFYFLTDRKKDLIKYKCNQISPTELEMVIRQLSHLVKDVAVVGVPHPINGQVPRAYVVPVPPSERDPSIDEEYIREAIVNHVNERVSPHKMLRGGVQFKAIIPRSQAGKILRKILQEHAANDQ